MLTIKVQVTLNDSADRWQLFVHEPGAEAAAQALNKAFCKAVNAGKDYREVMRAVNAVQKKYASLGAYDSEPFHHLDSLLRKVFPDAPI